MSPPAPNHNIPAGQLTNGGCRTKDSSDVSDYVAEEQL
jgi:hypothetical protein